MAAETLNRIIVLISVRPPPIYPTSPYKPAAKAPQGNGTNLQALIDACAAGAIPDAAVTHVVSNRKDAYGLQRAVAASIPTTLHSLYRFKQAHPEVLGQDEAARRAGYDAALAALVLGARPRLVVLAGFMHVLTPAFLAPLRAAAVPVLNLHPALRGEYNGRDALARAWRDWTEGRATRTGVMVHHVVAEVDMGEPVLQREVAFRAGESFEEFVERVHAVERPALVEATRLVLEGMREGGEATGGSGASSEEV